MTVKLEVKNLYKVFGPSPDKAFKLIDDGLDKDAIFERTGNTVGVKDASLAIHEGEIFVIMGLSGSGKSTLVRLLNRLIEPSRGEVLIDGENILAMNDAELRQVRRQKMAMVFQSFALMPHMTVLDNTAFGLELSGVPAETRRATARDALAQVGLEAHGDSYPDELSGGMQQRVALARCLANHPDVILMDEPLGALDALTREKMQSLVLKLWKETGKTIILITHSVEEALLLGERLLVMAPRPGRIHREYRLPFAEMGVNADLREVKKHPEFALRREEILGMIWDMEEEIMGRAEDSA